MSNNFETSSERHDSQHQNPEQHHIHNIHQLQRNDNVIRRAFQNSSNINEYLPTYNIHDSLSSSTHPTLDEIQDLHRENNSPPSYQTREFFTEPPTYYDTCEQARTDINRTTRQIFSRDVDLTMLQTHYEYPANWGKGSETTPHELECMTDKLTYEILIDALKSSNGRDLRTITTHEGLPFENWIEYGKKEYLEQESNSNNPLPGKTRLAILGQDMYRAAFFLGRRISENSIQDNAFLQYRNYMYDTISKHTALDRHINGGDLLHLESIVIKDYIEFEYFRDNKGWYINKMFELDMQQLQRHKGRALEKEDEGLYSTLDNRLHYLCELYQDIRVIVQYETQATSIYKTIAIRGISATNQLKPRAELWEHIGKTERIEDLSTPDLVKLREHEFKYTALKLGETIRDNPHISQYSRELLKPKASQYKNALEKYKKESPDNTKKEEIQRSIDELDKLESSLIIAGKATLGQRSIGLVQTAFKYEFEEKAYQYHKATLQTEKTKTQLREAKSQVQDLHSNPPTPQYQEATRTHAKLDSKVAELSHQMEQTLKEYDMLIEIHKEAKTKTIGQKPPYEIYKGLRERYDIDSKLHKDFIENAFSKPSTT